MPSSTQLTNSVKSTFTGQTPVDEVASRKFFEEAETKFKTAAAEEPRNRGLFLDAAKSYRSAALHWDSSAVEEDALMMMAECYFFADEYPEAVDHYGKLIKKYPNTRHLDQTDQRRFAIAQYWLALSGDQSFTLVPNVSDDRRPTLDTFGYAIKLFDSIRFDNPTGNLADDATMAAGVANFEQGKYGAADVLFDDLRENFPDSEHQFEAHLLSVKCKQNLYEGPDYDAGSLDRAEDMIRDMQLRFPRESAGEKEFLAQALKDIRLRKAEREYWTAQFYDRRKQFGAARLYYDNVKSDFADTSLGDESAQRLNSIADLPAEPEESLQWLANIFPEEDTRPKPLITRKTPDTKVR